MKALLSLISILLSITCIGQTPDTTRTPIGYDLDYPSLYVRVDTTHGMTQIFNMHHRKVFISVSGGRALEVSRGGVITAWSIHPLIVVTRKKFKQIYQL